MMHNHKDGHGAHWHALLWLIAITVMLSTATMLYAAWAFTANLPEARMTKNNFRLEQRMQRIEDRLDSLEASLRNVENMMEEEAMTRTEEATDDQATSTEEE